MSMAKLVLWSVEGALALIKTKYTAKHDVEIQSNKHPFTHYLISNSISHIQKYPTSHSDRLCQRQYRFRERV